MVKVNKTHSERPVDKDKKGQSLEVESLPKRSRGAMRSVHWILKDGLLLGSLGLAAFLFLVLFSYQATDPAFNGTSIDQTIQNYGGRTGAWLASFLLYVIGIFAFILPFGLLVASWVALKTNANNTSETRDYSRFLASLVGLLLMVLSGSALATLFMPDKFEWIQFPYSAGGVLGYEIGRFLVSALDLLATTLVLLILFAISVSMVLNTSWLTIFELTGRAVESAVLWVKPNLLKAFGNVRQKVAERSNLHSAGDGTGEESASSKTEEAGAKLVIPSIKKTSPIEKAMALKNRSKELELKGNVPENTSGQTLEARANKPKLMQRLLGKKGEEGEAKSKKPTASQVQTVSDAEAGEDAVQKSEQSAPNAGTHSEVKVGKRAQVNELGEPTNTGALPGLELLDEPPTYEEGYTEEQLRDLSFLLEQKLEEFGIKVKVESVQPGPVVTRFEILPAPGVKVSQINNLSKDLARVLSVKSVRVVDIIPGKAVIGIEIPNEERELVSFREILASDAFQRSESKLTVALGKDIAGKPVVADIAKMPHLLVAGTTGAGKSVGVNSMILSLLYKATPEEVRLIMVDPKMLELSVYEDIPHLLTPVVTDMSDAANALRWCVFEMDRRYQLMAKLGVRNIAGFNAKVKAAIEKGEPIIDPLYQQVASYGVEQAEAPPTLMPLPFIVVVVDEFADMIMVVGKEVEQLIARIAQKARAAGIHLILATQRPSVNVITGLIKANIPTRISFMVNTKIDSRTILDQGGAEQLLGMGDMLFMPPGTGTPIRVHGAFVSDDEVHRVAEFVKAQGEPRYLETITKMNSAEAEGGSGASGGNAEQDPLYDEAVAFVLENRRVSISLIQRQFKIGYNRSARIVEAMESAGIISKSGANGNREILVPKNDE